MMEGLHISVLASEEHSVILSGFHRFLEAHGSHSVAGIIYKQRIEKQQHVSSKQEHSLPDASRDCGHGNKYLIK